MDSVENYPFLQSKFPVSFPYHPALGLPQAEFEAFLAKDIKGGHKAETVDKPTEDRSDTATAAGTATKSTTVDVRETLQELSVKDADGKKAHRGSDTGDQTSSPFMKGLLEHDEQKKRQPYRTSDTKNKMRTENNDVAFRSSRIALVDLFSELEDVVSGPRLRELLNHAWRQDSLATLKIIFNARSIHLGKSSRGTTYRCFGWLAQNHPLTLVANLQWLSRPIIEKKMETREDKPESKSEEKQEEDDLVIVEVEKDEDDPTRFDVKNGVSHGYWKDLLNILALSVNEKLDVLADPRQILNVQQDLEKKDINWSTEDAKTRKAETNESRHKAALKAIKERPVHRALHLTITRLFVAQLKTDLAHLQSGDARALRKVSLCAKWAPTQKLFHDKHTFIVSSIAEMLHPRSEFKDVKDRKTYLRHARDAYRRDVAALRRHLEIVERDITAETFTNIKYERVPSLAMNQYSALFAKKDLSHFEAYVNRVVSGKKKISGATLMPSTLVKLALEGNRAASSRGATSKKRSAKQMIALRLQDVDRKRIDVQWNALVQRMKDSGTIDNCIAVCDVSGSMGTPVFSDGTAPIHSAIGLSLLLAEITKPPFGGAFITFSAKPTVQKVNLKATLAQKIRAMNASAWDMNTDFAAVFEKLILRVAVQHKLKQEDMVKRVFVFSDMQFDEADGNNGHWSTSYQRIQKKFSQAGYEMPQLVFWNLAGGRAGYTGRGDPVAPKPVEAAEEGTALVSGYSQGMLKVFLKNMSFDPEEEEEELVEEEAKDGTVEVQKKKKQKLNPMTTVKRAISHEAYSMLKVVD